jgi:hypothetical protein
MPTNPRADPVLIRLRAALHEIYGDPLERGRSYGSRARGEERPGSDYDIAVFIENLGSLGDEPHRLASVTTDTLLYSGAFISAIPLQTGAFRERTGFIHELRNDGLGCVRPEAADYLDKAHHCLAGGKTIASSGPPDVAAREGYLAALHAAEVHIFERTGNAAKTHRGVRFRFTR